MLSPDYIRTFRRIHFENSSYNHLTLLEGPSGEKYVLKETPLARKEAKAIDLTSQHNLINTLEVVYVDDNSLMTGYLPDLVPFDSWEAYLDVIARFHINGILANERIIPNIASDPNFVNTARTRAKIRLQKHGSEVQNLGCSQNALENFIDKHSEVFSTQGQTLVHGDLNLGNLLTDSRTPYLLDFESALFDFPSWDIARVLVYAKSIEEVRRMIDYYTKVFAKKRKEANLEEISEEQFQRQIQIDAVFLSITLGITVQSRDKSFMEQRGKFYLEQTRMLLQGVLGNEI